MRKTLMFALSALLFVIMISSPTEASTLDGATPSSQPVCTDTSF
jgi:hypothetical protein